MTSSHNGPACKVLDNSIHSSCMLWEFRGSWNLIYALMYEWGELDGALCTCIQIAFECKRVLWSIARGMPRFSNTTFVLCSGVFEYVGGGVFECALSRLIRYVGKMFRVRVDLCFFIYKCWFCKSNYVIFDLNYSRCVWCVCGWRLCVFCELLLRLWQLWEAVHEMFLTTRINTFRSRHLIKTEFSGVVFWKWDYLYNIYSSTLILLFVKKIWITKKSWSFTSTYTLFSYNYIFQPYKSFCRDECSWSLRTP